jgi:hypothetical protein
MKTSIEGRALAITAGGLFAVGTLGILLEDVIMHSAPFTLKHALTVVVVAGTIMVGHLAAGARSAGHWGAVAGFGVLFLAGTLLTVYSSVGRQAEHTMIASAEVQAAELARARATKGLGEAETMLADAQRELARECKTGRGKRCEGIKATVDVYDAAVRGHKAELERLGPAKVAVPEAKRAGELAAVFGADPVKVEAAMVLLIPFLTTLFLELGAIICLGYGFRPSRKIANDNRPSVRDTEQTSFPIDPDGGSRKRVFTRNEAQADVISLVERRKPIPSQDDLADRWNVTKSCVSKWLTLWEEDGLIQRESLGRCKTVRAA